MMIEATLRLFNAIQVEDKWTGTQMFLERTIKNGYLLHPDVAPLASDRLLNTIEKIVGISGEKANASFHKSWEKVKTARIEQLVLEQIIHYITTYGFEVLDIFDHDSVYIPYEKLEIPALKVDGLRLTLIRPLTRDEVLENILDLCSGIALSDQTLDDIMEIEKVNQYKYALLERGRMKNRELRARLYALYDLVPDEPEEFLRYVITTLTGESLLIKNTYLIKKILAITDTKKLDALLQKAPNLAPIFYRFKPLLLALKKKAKDKGFFNQTRKAAVKQHVPLKPAYLSTVTSRVKHGLGVDELPKHLKGETVFRKIRLAQALRYRANPGPAIVYRVRNGKGWAEGFTFQRTREAEEALEIVLQSIADGMRQGVAGKTFYMPDYFQITLPATEKQFIGNFPIGSSITSLDDLIVGIHWENVKGQRIDLDLAGISLGRKVGWDASYRSLGGNHHILFSGDITDAPAPKGATELIYLSGKYDDQLISVNYFNHHEGMPPVPATIIVSKGTDAAKKEFQQYSHKNHMVDPNNILASPRITVAEPQTVLGMVSEGTFYFVNTTIGNTRSSSQQKHVLQARQFMMDSLSRLITFEEVLKRAKATVVSVRPLEGEYVDLSPENLDKTTLIKLLS